MTEHVGLVPYRQAAWDEPLRGLAERQGGGAA
jgi:hypothetical protein